MSYEEIINRLVEIEVNQNIKISNSLQRIKNIYQNICRIGFFR